MKKIIVILLLVMTAGSYSQITTNQLPFRVVTVSPNYTNVYPRFRTLQATYTAIRDSASVSTGKYFAINVVSDYHNISDWSSGWKDSILNRTPYMKMYALGTSIVDSIVAVTVEEFLLASGILSLNPLIAGDGLSFISHKLAIITQNYLGNALYLDGDSLKIRIDNTLLFTPNLLGVNFKFNNGMISDTGGIGVQVVAPLSVSGDYTSLNYKRPFRIVNDSLYFDYAVDYFVYDSSVFFPANFRVKLDSGFQVNSSGISILPDHRRLIFNDSIPTQLTISNAIAGTGLIWTSDSLCVGLSYQFTGYNDSIWIDMNTRQFDLRYGESPSVNIALDSGMTYASSGATTGIKPKIDYSTLIFNSLLQLVVNPTLAGGGLLMTAGVIDIIPNDFAKVENDTLKIKTSTVFTWFGDSLNSTIFYVPPYDTLGIGMFAKGNVKRVAINYVTDNGNDTTVMNFLDASWNAYDRIALAWDNSQMKFKIYKNKVLWQTLAGCANLTSPYKKDWNVAMETYLEAR